MTVAIFFVLSAVFIAILYSNVKPVDDLEDNLQVEHNRVQEVENGSKLTELYDVMEIYTANLDTYEQESFLKVAITKEGTVEERFKVLMRKVGKYFFNIPIDDISFYQDGDKRIAVVNLKESDENRHFSNPANFVNANWAAMYFQGSTGGTVTTITLTETALQKTYEGEWIDGVTFLYEGENIVFDHVYGLSELNLRHE